MPDTIRVIYPVRKDHCHWERSDSRRFAMDLQQLHTFKTVVDEGGFSAAGQKLFRSQPAVSLALKRLEEEDRKSVV